MIYAYPMLSTFFNENFAFNADGMLSFKVNGVNYKGMLDYGIFSGNANGATSFEIQPFNEHFMMVYPTGHRQIIYTVK